MKGFCDRTGKQSSQASKAVNEAAKLAAAAEKKAGQAEATAQREKERRRKADAKRKKAEDETAKLHAEMSALFCGDRNDPRLTNRGRLFARALTTEALRCVQRQVWRNEMEERAQRRSELKKLKDDLAHQHELRNAANKRTRKAEKRVQRLLKQQKHDKAVASQHCEAIHEDLNAMVDEVEDKAEEIQELVDEVQYSVTFYGFETELTL
jgi:delta 1-pyrroline-5-carboxylate dehydrogenase